MNAFTCLAALTVPTISLVACKSDPDASAPSAPPQAAIVVDAAPVQVASSAADTLAHMDTRAPVPLVPMMANHQKASMRDHLVAVEEIVAGLAADDFASIEKAAGRIGFSEQMGQMCRHMGAGAPGFTEQALAFHHTADTIGDAARKKDRVAVTKALTATLKTCTGCHAAYRQDVVDDATFAKRTALAPPTGPMHHGPSGHGGHPPATSTLTGDRK